MKEYVLNYYPKFECIAGECKHTCCKGWETCIDSDTLNIYRKDESNFSTHLKAGINFKKSTFKMDKDRRCAFLNEKGLCKIILNLGKEKLCQICRDHPRFKSGFSSITETGLGFCCEEATKIILSFTEKIQPVLINDGDSEELDFCEKAVFDFRAKALALLQDRNAPISDRVNTVLSIANADFNSIDGSKILKTFLTFKRLNKSWGVRLKNLKNTPFTFTANESLALYCEQFLVNSVYRHLSTAEDIVGAQAVTVAIIISWFVIQNVYYAEATNENEFSVLVDVVREFSAEVEYCPQNVTKLFNFANKFIK